MKIMKWRFGRKSRERIHCSKIIHAYTKNATFSRDNRIKQDVSQVSRWSNQLEASSRKMIREVMRHRLRSSSTSVQVVLTRTRSLASMRLVTNSWERHGYPLLIFHPAIPFTWTFGRIIISPRRQQV